MNSDWSSFTLTLYDQSYYLGYSRPIEAGKTIYTCQNQLFQENWRTLYNQTQRDAIYRRLEDLLTPVEKGYLAQLRKDLRLKYPTKSTSPSFYAKFLLTDNQITEEKIFAYVANSLFGRQRDVSLSIPEDALTQFKSIPNLCDIVFKGTLSSTMGTTRNCNFI